MKKPRFTERKRRHRVDSWRGGSHTALVLAAVLLAGCAIQNTPQQERTWAAYEACKAAGRVPHGHIWSPTVDGGG